MARPHLTQTTPVPTLLADFIQRMDNAAKKYKSGQFTRTLKTDTVVMRYVTQRVSEGGTTDVACRCTIRRVKAGTNELESVFQFGINGMLKNPGMASISVEEAEKRLTETINMLETGVKLSEIEAFVFQPKSQPTTAAESISDIKRKLERLI